MQRLNAIFSFLENEFPVNGEYFELDALVDTKSRKDAKELAQQSPVMSRQKSAAFCNYTIALSIFRSNDPGKVDEVFRRINSGGKTLSFQELRQAGTVSQLADLVRILSSRIRTDISPRDAVPLSEMPRLSITNKELAYGVVVEEIFWVKHGILRGDDVRISDDEQLVLDILTDCLIHPFITGSRETRDKAYGFVSNEGSEPISERLATRLEKMIDNYGRDVLEQHFMDVYDVMRDIINVHDKRFANVIGIKRGGRAPRYFHGLFVAIFEMMFSDGLRLKDREGAAKRLVDISNNALRIPPGSDWSGDSKRESVDSVKTRLMPFFEKSSSEIDFGRYGRASHLEKILGNAVIEQQLFDVKQGLHRLDSQRKFDEQAFSKVCETLSAMANHGPACVGYLVLGVSDKPADTSRVEALDSIRAVRFRNFDVIGLDREASQRGQRMAEYWDWLVRKVRADKNLDSRIADQVTGSASTIDFRGFSVGVLEVRGLLEANIFGDSIYERSGSENLKVSRRDEGRIHRRFHASEKPDASL